MKSSEETQPRSDERTGLSRIQFWAVFAIAVTLFVFQSGPIWRHAWDLEHFDGAVYWSYAAIPPLVIALLLASKRFSWRSLLGDTFGIAVIKYVTTFGIALVLWELMPAPAEVQVSRHHGAPVAESDPVLVPTRIDPARTGALRGIVTDASGKPVQGATVWIAGGLEEFVFAAPQDPVSFDVDHGESSPLIVVQVGQKVLARTSGRGLHTMIAKKDERLLFNVPLLASGEPSRVSFREAEGLLTISCNVHPGSRDRKLLVVGHPFFAVTGEDGAFAFRGVPAGEVRVAAMGVEGRPFPEAMADVASGAEVEASLSPAVPTAAAKP